jgi:hypothetical protein
VETNNERRLRKLTNLCSAHGGPAAVAKRSGLNPASLRQILNGIELPRKLDGSRSERGLGDPAARAIEEAYDLGRGWFDNDEVGKMEPRELQLIGLFRELDEALQRIVVDNVREVVEERARMVERMRRPTPAFKVTPPEPERRS